jgi:halimadienyl-diphosphate synthase
VMQMTTFYVLWVLRSLSRIPGTERWIRPLVPVPAAAGLQVGPGLPPDGDDTAVALYLLQRGGSTVRLDGLLPFIGRDGMCAAYAGERNPSLTVTAHALDAVGMWLTTHAEDHPLGQVRDRMVAALLDGQDADGCWNDKWHASPTYAVDCCVNALIAYGGQVGRRAVRRAVDWLLGTQRGDGSWGRWTGTLEETAYALHTLLSIKSVDPRCIRSVAVGAAFLAHRGHATADQPERTPMWHGKELYEPQRVVQAAILSASLRCRKFLAQQQRCTM